VGLSSATSDSAFAYEGGGRAELATHTREVLSRGGWGNPDVYLVEWSGTPVVVKDFGPRSFWVRWLWGAWMNRREIHAYRRLETLRVVPRYLGSLDRFAFVLEYRPGVRLSRALVLSVPAGFIAELGDAVAAMHQLGVVHLDLRHRSNVLAGEDGHPVLIDFASAIRFRPESWAARWILPGLARIDLLALGKWEQRLGTAARAQALAERESRS
jgi:serine/threonine protein kinase